MIGSEGIQANPEKTRAILAMVEPSNKKEVQRLTGRITALNRFISRSAERSLPFFRALKGNDKMEWGLEQSKAFHDLKCYLADNPAVNVPNPQEPLLLYVVALHHAVSAVLVQEVQLDAKKEQRPVYYILEALSAAKLNYTEVEKVIYAVLTSSRKLKHYFQVHEITVPSSQPLGDILGNKGASGRIAKWATELSQYGINYVHKTAIKSQALADFMADWTPSEQTSCKQETQV